MRFISKLEIKNGILVKGRQLEGNRKIGIQLSLQRNILRMVMKFSF